MSIAVISAIVFTGQVSASPVTLQAAHFKTGTAQSVKLLWYPASGWVPSNGYRLYRRVGDQRTLIFPPSGFAMTSRTNSGLSAAWLKRETDWSATWSLAGQDIIKAGKVSTPATIEAATMPVSSKPQFDELRRLLAGPEIDPAALSGNYTSLPNGNPLKTRATSGMAGYRVSGAEVISDQILNARRQLIGAAVANEPFGAQIGFRTEDVLPIGVARPIAYELHSMTGTTESQSPIASTNITVTGTPVPSELAQVEGFQSGEGKISLRWKRPSVAQEQQAGGLIRYRIYRGGVRLNRLDTAIMDAEQENGSSIEPIAFYVDQTVPNQSAVFSYRVESIDIFGRVMSVGTASVGTRDLRIPPPPSLFLPVAFKSSPMTANAPSDARSTVLISLPQPELIGEIQVNRLDLENAAEGWVQVPFTKRAADVLGLGFDSPPMGSTPEVAEIVKQIYGPERATRSTDSELRKLVTDLFRNQLPVITFDSTALKDRYYKYRIRVKSPAGVWSGYTESPACGIPLEVSPGKVATLAGVFSPLASENSLQGVGSKKYVQTGPLAKRIEATTGLQLAPLQPVGGTVKLTWNHSTTQRGVTFLVQRKLPGNKNWENLKMNHPVQSFTDKLPLTYKAVAAYRVTPISRWAVAGSPTIQLVELPSTQTPSPVETRKISLNDNGSLTVSFAAGLAKEQIVRYRILRKVTENLTTSKIDSRLLFGRGPKATNGSQQLTGVTIQTGKLNDLQRKLSPVELDGYSEVGTIAGDVSTSESGEILWTDSRPVESKQNWYIVICETTLGKKSAMGTPLGAVPLKIFATLGTNFTGSARSGSVSLTWKNATDTVSVQVLRRLKQEPVEQNLELAGAVTTESHVDLTARRGRTYIYTIRYRDMKGNLSPSSEIEVSVPLSP